MQDQSTSTFNKGNPAFPLNDRIIRNDSYGGPWIDFCDSNASDFCVVTMRDDLIAHAAPLAPQSGFHIQQQ